MFSSFDCAVKGVRGGKEDPANAIIAGFLTGGTLAFRSGPKPMLVSAIGCGLLLGVFEGVGALIGRVFARYNRPVAPLLPEPPQQPVRTDAAAMLALTRARRPRQSRARFRACWRAEGEGASRARQRSRDRRTPIECTLSFVSSGPAQCTTLHRTRQRIGMECRRGVNSTGCRQHDD